MSFRAINLAILAQGPDRDTCPLMVGTVTGWRSLPSQPTAASIPRGYVHGFPKARLPFRHLSARYLHVDVCVRICSRGSIECVTVVCSSRASFSRACVCEGINRLDSLFAAARELNKVSGHVSRNRLGFSLP